MFAEDRYLAWARRFYGKVPFDLATSGMPTLAAAELGDPQGARDDPAYWEAFRAAIAHHNDVPVREAIAALGTTHALWLAYVSLLSPGDEVVIETPGYEPLRRIAEGVGARPVFFERPAATGYAIDPDRVARAMSERTRLVVVTNLHNPSGARAPDASLAALADLAASRGAHLLVDEVYAPFDAFADASGVFTTSARKLAPNVVVASSLTKCYGLGPHRLGWLLGPAEIVARAENAVTSSVGIMPLPHAHLGVHALASVVDLSRRAHRLLGEKRERVARWMAERPHLAWSAPAEGLFGFAVSSRAGDLTAAIEAGAKDHGVLVAAGSFFGVPNGFRVSWSIVEEKLEEGLEQLGRVVG